MTANEKSITVFFILICEKLCGPVNKTNLLKESDYERFSLKNYKHSKTKQPNTLSVRTFVGFLVVYFKFIIHTNRTSHL
jgi:hypothetical protein